MKYRLFILIILCCLNSSGQEKKVHSIELQGNTMYYFLNNEKYSNTGSFSNLFNYGVTVLYSSEISRNFSLSSGLNFSTKNYYWETLSGNVINQYEKWEHNIKYLNIPFYIDYKIFRMADLNIRILQGAILNYRIDHDYKKYDSESHFIEIENQDIRGFKYDTAIFYRCGFIFSYLMNKRIKINFMPYIDYKVIMDKPPRHSHLTDDRIVCGISLGVSYIL